MMIASTRLHSRWFYRTTLVGLSLAFVILCAAITTPQIAWQKIAFGPYNNYRCSTGNTAESGIFQVHMLAFDSAVNVAEALCRDPEIAARYGSVQIRWIRRKDTQANVLLSSGMFDLVFFIRDYTLDALSQPKKNAYTPIAHLQAAQKLGSYLLSKDPHFEVSSEYLAGKKIGLLSEVSSHSRYRVPQVFLKSTAIADDQYEIVLLETDLELSRALELGEVDIIAILSANGEDSRGKTVFAGTTDYSSSFSYIASHHAESGLACSVVGTLQKLVNDGGIHYLSAIEPVEATVSRCTEQQPNQNPL